MIKSKRRRDSLIPLSREHNYALMLCLRINRGMKNHAEDREWIRAQAGKTVKFFETDLLPHFQAEESVLFPAMDAMPRALSLVSSLLKDHAEMRSRIESLRKWNDATMMDELLQFAFLLEQHIRKEERELFPIYEEHVNTEIDTNVQHRILELIGDGLQPKYPELIE